MKTKTTHTPETLSYDGFGINGDDEYKSRLATFSHEARQTGDDNRFGPLFAAAPELLEALKYAQELIPLARKYFPKSVKNSDKFKLENTCATINNAIRKAEGR